MKVKIILVVSLFLFILVIGSFVFTSKTKPRINSNNQISNSATKEVINIKLTSSVFENNSDIPTKHTCDGDNISPPLSITEVFSDAKSLALIVDDPDAPAGDWVHWLVWNINPTTKEIAEGKAPEGSFQGLNDFGQKNYGGPCPPSGKHRYQFKLYALDNILDLPTTVKKKDLLSAMEGHILDQTVLVGIYQRQ